MSKHLLYKGSVIALTVFQFLVLQFAFLPNSEQFANAQAAPFTSMSVTVANGRLSFKGAVATSGYINTTTLRIAASGQPDNDTRNLFNGDAICVNPSGDICHQQLTHPVNYLATDNITFGVSTAFPHDIANATPLVASQSGRIIVSFRPRVAVPAGGSIRVYIPANATNTTAQNGIPDADGFDSARIDNISAGSFGSVVVPSFTTTAASITYTHASSNHVFSVPVTTTPLNTSTTYYITIGDAAADRQLFVNPAPCLTCQSGGTAHTTRGLADPYNFRVESLDASSNLQDSTTTSVAVNDGVLVSVTVPLSLTYQISAVTASTALSCPGVSGGITTDVATTATSVPFGTLSTATNGGIGSPIDAAHQHAVTTNSPNGYSLTVYEDGVLTSTSSTIADVSCNGSGDTACATPTSNGTWNSNATFGFGYSMVGNNAAGIADVSTAGVTGYRPFRLASTLSWPATTVPPAIMTRTTSTASSTAYSCYRLNVAATQQAGFYFNKLFYVATANF